MISRSRKSSAPASCLRASYRRRQSRISSCSSAARSASASCAKGAQLLEQPRVRGQRLVARDADRKRGAGALLRVAQSRGRRRAPRARLPTRPTRRRAPCRRPCAAAARCRCWSVRASASDWPDGRRVLIGLRDQLGKRLEARHERLDARPAVVRRPPPRRRVIAPLAQVARRARAGARSGRLPSSSPKRHLTGRRNERRTPSCGLPSCACSQDENASSKTRSACVSVSTANAGSTRASTGRSRSSSAQKPWMVLTCASSKSCTAASSRRPASESGAVLRPRALQLFAQAQLQLAGGLLAEGHGHDLADRGALVARSARRCGRPARWSCRCRPRPRQPASCRARWRSARGSL